MPKFSTCRSPWIQIRPLSVVGERVVLVGRRRRRRGRRCRGRRRAGRAAILRNFARNASRVGLHQRRERVVEDSTIRLAARLVGGMRHPATRCPGPDAPGGSRSPPARSSSSASRSVTARSPRRQAPAGSSVTRASTCIGWWARARSANRSRSAAASTNRWPAVARRTNRTRRGQVERHDHQDRDQRHRQAQPERPAPPRPPPGPPASASRSAAPAGLVERRAGLVADERARRRACRRRPACARTGPVADSVDLLARVRPAPGWRRGRRSRPDPERPARPRAAGRRATWRAARPGLSAYSFMGPSDHIGYAVLTASRVATAGTPAPRAAGRLLGMSTPNPSKNTNAFFLQAGISFGDRPARP